MPPANASQHLSDQDIDEEALRKANRLRPENLELVKALVSSTGCMIDKDSPGRPIPMNEIRPIQISMMMEALACTESLADFVRYWPRLTGWTPTEGTLRDLQPDVLNALHAEIPPPVESTVHTIDFIRIAYNSRSELWVKETTPQGGETWKTPESFFSSIHNDYASAQRTANYWRRWYGIDEISGDGSYGTLPQQSYSWCIHVCEPYSVIPGHTDKYGADQPTAEVNPRLLQHLSLPIITVDDTERVPIGRFGCLFWRC